MMANRSVRRPALFIAVALLASLAGSANAQTTYPLMVSGTAGGFSPNPLAPQVQATSTLSATVSNGPTPSYTQQIQGPIWSWSLGTIQFSPTQGGGFQPAPAGSYTAIINQPASSAADATLTATFNQPGMWMVTATVTVTYTDLPATDKWTGSATVMTGCSVYNSTPTPTLALTANQYAVCAGGQSDSLHQSVLTATVTDGQGHPSPGVLVDFTRTDGSLSATAATTDANGQAQTTLTSSQNATDGGGQYFATVTATLDTQQSAYSSVQIEFQPPSLSLTASPGAIASGDTSQLTLGLTWNGSPVRGHAVSWRISRIWDANQQLVYNDSGSAPQGYLALTGAGQAASPTNQQGQAIQIGQAGATPGKVEIAADDKSVQGAHTQANPEKKVAVAAGTVVLLKSLEFTSDHAKLCDGGDVVTAGKRYTKPEWTSGGDNNPITHTAGDSTKITAKVTITVAAGAFPANTPCTLSGICEGENALNFAGSGTLSAGDNTINVTATNPIGKQIRKLNGSVSRSLGVTSANQTFMLGATGLHVVYTTLGTPDDSGPDGSTVPNPSRMDIVVPRVSAAIAAANSYTNNAAIIWQLNKSGGTYYLGRGLWGKPAKTGKQSVEPWYLPQVATAAGAKAYDNNATPGADCASISTFLTNVCKITGLKGAFDFNTYIAYYQTKDEPKRPTTAIIGSLNKPHIHPGDQGVSPIATNTDWGLGLADSSCLGGTAVDPATGKPLPGRVGCTGGINAYEAAVLYTDPNGVTWFLPGGTPHIYKSKDKVIQIFRTLVWIDVKDPTQDFDPNTNPFMVYAVDYVYNAAFDYPADDTP